MVEFHFIQDPTVLGIIQGILDVAGPNFTAPFDSTQQPYDGSGGNNETLLQFQMPGGSTLRGYAEPSAATSIGAGINSMLAAFAPAFSAYALILPILGVIRGIIEVICAMMNPFSVARAVTRLFRKWIPPFISLFPPFAGVILIISTIKAIIAIVFYILTIVVPTIQLIIDCFEKIRDLRSGDIPEEQREAILASINAKVEGIIASLAQKTGVLGVLLPLLEILFTILGLVSGFPCKKGNSDRANATAQSINEFPIIAGPDVTCCEELCPEILSDRSLQPSGVGVLVQSSFGDCAPGFVFRLITNDAGVAEFEPFHEASQAQLNCQLDEPISGATPVGSTGDTSTLKVRLTSRRGVSRSVLLPVLDINGSELKVTSPIAALLVGAVNYTLEPDYDMLVFHNIIGVGCHPDVQDAATELQNTFSDLETPVTERLPEIATLLDDTSDINDQIGNAITDLEACADSAFSRTDPDDIDEDIQCANDVQDDLLDLLNAFVADLTGRLNGILDKIVDTSASLFEVDKTTVIADGQDVGVITITPRDVTGTPIIRNLPADVGLTVNIFTTFGVISNQQVNNSAGTVTANISSLSPGTASITVNLNGNPIIDIDGTTVTTRTRRVRFVQEATLPARRRRSKPSAGKAINTGVNSEKEQGNK